MGKEKDAAPELSAGEAARWLRTIEDSRQMSVAAWATTAALLRGLVESGALTREAGERIIDGALAFLQEQNPPLPGALRLLQEWRLHWMPAPERPPN